MARLRTLAGTLLLLGAIVFTGCGVDHFFGRLLNMHSSGGYDSATSAISGAPAMAPALPAPSALPRCASSAPLDSDAPGNSYEAALGDNHCAAEGLAARFSPAWIDASSSSAADLAYAFYAFDLAGHAGAANLTLSFSQPPTVETDLWVGLADYGANRWEWHTGTLASALNLPALGGYANGADQAVLAIVLMGTNEAILDSLRLDRPATPPGLTNIFFLHHSTGAGLVFDGDMRGAITDYNAAHSTAYEFWDHGYQSDGLTDPDGNPGSTNYGPMTDYTDPPDLHNLWTSPDVEWTTLRTTILDNHEVIAFKSCFPASAIPDTTELEYRKGIYLDMRNFFDTRLDKLFVVVSTPPLHRLATNATDAGYAREFAEWLKSSEYLSEHPNVVCFDLFNALAQADDASTAANMLRSDYEGSPDSDDSHPNATANAAVGPLFAQFLCDAAGAYTPLGP